MLSFVNKFEGEVKDEANKFASHFCHNFIENQKMDVVIDDLFLGLDAHTEKNNWRI